MCQNLSMVIIGVMLKNTQNNFQFLQHVQVIFTGIKAKVLEEYHIILLIIVRTYGCYPNVKLTSLGVIVVK